VPLTDTTPQAREVCHRRLAELTPSERTRITATLWQAGDRMQRAAIRQANPDATEQEVVFQLAVSRFGLASASKVYRRR
jgi:hypothetical protein